MNNKLLKQTLNDKQSKTKQKGNEIVMVGAAFFQNVNLFSHFKISDSPKAAELRRAVYGQYVAPAADVCGLRTCLFVDSDPLAPSDPGTCQGRGYRFDLSGRHSRQYVDSAGRENEGVSSEWWRDAATDIMNINDVYECSLIWQRSLGSVANDSRLGAVRSRDYTGACYRDSAVVSVVDPAEPWRHTWPPCRCE